MTRQFLKVAPKAGARDEYLLREFIMDLQVQGLARRTVLEYAANVRRYLTTTSKTIDTTEYEDLRSYYLDSRRKNVDDSHLKVWVNSVKKFWQWYSRKYHVADITISLKAPKPKIIDPYIPNEDDIEMAIEYCFRKASRSKSMKRQFTYFENAAMIAFIVGTGVRVSELIEVKIKDIEIDPEKKFFHLRIYSPKSRRQRDFDFAYIANSTCVGEVFSLYWQFRLTKFEYSPDDPLFPCVVNFPKGDRKLTRSRVWDRFRRMSRTVNAERKRANLINPHSLRHFNATYLYLNHTDLREIQYRLGHAFLSTTERYIHIAARRRGTIPSQLADATLRVPTGISGFSKLVRSILLNQTRVRR